MFLFIKAGAALGDNASSVFAPLWVCLAWDAYQKSKKAP
jgi:hypothetical protein